MAACLCGCVRPAAYKRPAPPVPNAWPDSAASQAGAPDAPEAAAVKWREFFTDRGLQSVIELALANNRDLRMAALNVERVQALYRIQRAQQYPHCQRGGQPGGLPASGRRCRTTGEAQTVGAVTSSLGSASWELDLFGRIRSLKSAGAGTVPGDRAGPLRDADRAGGRCREQLSRPGRRSGQPAPGPGDPRRPAGFLRTDPAHTGCGHGLRPGPSPGAEPGGGGARRYRPVHRPGGPRRKRAQPPGGDACSGQSAAQRAGFRSVR